MKDNPAPASAAYAGLAQYCAYRERSAAEVRQKMQRMGLDPGDAETLLQRLQVEGFQSETRYARAFTRDKYSLEQWGRVRIRRQLREKGVDEATIAEALTHIEEPLYRANLSRLLLRQAAGLRGISGFELRARLLRYVSGKGYESGLAMQLLRELDLGEGEPEPEASQDD
jgi:regulatory protein